MGTFWIRELSYINVDSEAKVTDGPIEDYSVIDFNVHLCDS
jgi:hypothetical protein